MTQQTYYMNIIRELHQDGILTINEARKAEIRLMKKLNYKWKSWLR